jgi:hypothetical protein
MTASFYYKISGKVQANTFKEAGNLLLSAIRKSGIDSFQVHVSEKPIVEDYQSHNNEYKKFEGNE